MAGLSFQSSNVGNMNVKILAPHGCNGTSILLSDVVRIENRSLSYFKACAYNLYIVEKKPHTNEFFTLYCYNEEKDMLRAYNTIASLLKDSPPEAVILEMVPM